MCEGEGSRGEEQMQNIMIMAIILINNNFTYFILLFILLLRVFDGGANTAHSIYMFSNVHNILIPKKKK